MTTPWLPPPRIKIHEALGAVIDGRVDFLDAFRTEARVWSSTRNKAYDVRLDPGAPRIACNDNGSFYRGYLGYPAIAVLLARGDIAFSEEVAAALAGIPWKDWNQELKNDFERTEIRVRELATERGILSKRLDAEVDRILAEVVARGFVKLGRQTKPPEGY